MVSKKKTIFLKGICVVSLFQYIYIEHCKTIDLTNQRNRLFTKTRRSKRKKILKKECLVSLLTISKNILFLGSLSSSKALSSRKNYPPSYII